MIVIVIDGDYTPHINYLRVLEESQGIVSTTVSSSSLDSTISVTVSSNGRIYDDANLICEPLPKEYWHNKVLSRNTSKTFHKKVNRHYINVRNRI
jgi:hypothetical protein